MSDILPFKDKYASINPMAIGELLEVALKPLFAKSKVTVRTSNSKQELNLPMISWNLHSRVPKKGLGATGPNYIKSTTLKDGFSRELYRRDFEVYMDYVVYANSNSEAKSIAWDLENYLLNIRPRVFDIFNDDDMIYGFEILFVQQLEDSTSKVNNNEIITKTLRFKITVPVYYSVTMPVIKFTQIEFYSGETLYLGQTFIRTESDTSFYIPITVGKYVNRIFNIYREINDELVTLIPSIDYDIYLEDGDLLKMSIIWLDDSGSTPDVDEEFYIDYTVSSRVSAPNVPIADS